MATLVLTNTKSFQALSGQGVRVTLSWAEANTNLSLIEPGMRCEVDGTGAQGTVASVDKMSNSFLANPDMPINAFASTPGYLMASETVNVYTT